MTYQVKPRSHIVSAGYLRAWTHDREIAMRLVGREESVTTTSVRNVGVRNNFYRRERPKTGETIYDAEWSIEQMETAALPIIRSLASRWPLSFNDKACAAQFFGLQYVRGPAFKEWHERDLRPTINAVRSDPVGRTVPVPGESPEEVADGLIKRMSSDTVRIIKMIGAARTVAVAFGSMHWSLVRFAKPRLVTSDEPVIAWPLSRGRARPCPNDLNSDLTDALEVFVPLAPHLLLLMTWVDRPDEPSVIGGANRHIATANAFVVANADCQWFHAPGFEPWLAAGPRDPLSAQCSSVTTSRRRPGRSDDATPRRSSPPRTRRR